MSFTQGFNYLILLVFILSVILFLPIKKTSQNLSPITFYSEPKKEGIVSRRNAIRAVIGCAILTGSAVPACMVGVSGEYLRRAATRIPSPQVPPSPVERNPLSSPSPRSLIIP